MSKYSKYGRNELELYIKNKQEKCSQKQAFCESLSDGCPVAGVYYNNRKRYFNSIIDPVKAAKVWNSQFTEDKFGLIYYIFGLSNGEYVRQLMSITDSSNMILVYEPSKELFDSVIDSIDIHDILEDERVTVIVEGINSNCIVDYISANTTYINKDFIRFYVSPNYNVYEEEIERLRSILNYQLENVNFTQITEEYLKDYMLNNEFLNLPVIVSERIINQLKKAFVDIDVSNVPAIVISAGPSLDKNIKEILNAQGKAFIIAVDTALKAVLRAEIDPDMTVCVDSRKELELFQLEGIKKIPAVYALNVPHKIVDNHTGPIFFCGEDNSYTNYLYKEYYGEKADELAAGGSVANTAFSLAVKLGFETIILVGQDLAFTGGRGHTKDAYDNEEKNKNDLNNYELTTVEDIEGNPITTDIRMKSYIKWFENQIIKLPEIKVIDATGGGAKIHGTDIMTLNDAILQYCRRDVDLKSVIGTIPPVFTHQQQDDIRNSMLHINEQLDVLAGKIQKGIDTYKLVKNSTDRASLLKDIEVYTVIENINSMEESEPLMNYVQIEATEDKYNLTQNLYHNKRDNASDDIEEVSDNAIRLLSAYLKAIERLKKRTPLLVDQLNTD